MFKNLRKMTSIHSNTIQDIYDMPIEVIKRPLQSQVDDEKVQSLMKTLKVSNILNTAY